MDEMGYHESLALLDWQVELGADEAIQDRPVNRFEAPAEAPKPVSPAPLRSGPAPVSPIAAPPPPDPAEAVGAAVDLATRLAAQARDLPALQAAMAGFELCDLKRGARNLVFADGNPAARVMIVGEAPGRDEDRQGKPFVGRAGQLLDRMFDAIGLSRQAESGEAALYITNMLPWRPPQNRDPKPDELAMLLPFVRRHIDLADPEVVVLMGNWACQGLLGRRGITRLRGQWDEVQGRPALPMFHPAFLLRQPPEKAKAWADLLALNARRKGE
ncbi:Uracil-DNA glycosylase, family 4 [Roseibacterium elongatum DSM 19469]|uniref:Type-4 uracil-DNA glycosylase n=1 Tax=Roseicyclus elongatus DSM 19469 TaxID=1294273 RepID=W8RPL3_9RHOB|nr:uracil-DNA glycosylase [Roseibacterium elongatum]AHM03114.1 Uracil-DNA glycosylase, family 4 [Roseibacterium elongatum DSM 19469]